MHVSVSVAFWFRFKFKLNDKFAYYSFTHSVKTLVNCSLCTPCIEYISSNSNSLPRLGFHSSQTDVGKKTSLNYSKQLVQVEYVTLPLCGSVNKNCVFIKKYCDFTTSLQTACAAVLFPIYGAPEKPLPDHLCCYGGG